MSYLDVPVQSIKWFPNVLCCEILLPKSVPKHMANQAIASQPGMFVSHVLGDCVTCRISSNHDAFEEAVRQTINKVI